MATKADIDKWIAEQGGADAVAHAFEDVELPDPRGMRNLPDGSPNDDYDRAFKDKKISTRRETWTNKTTGATFSAVRTPFANDQFEDIKQTPPNKTPQQQAAAAGASTAQAEPPKEKEENGRRYIWKPNPGGPTAGGQWVDVGPAAAKPEDRVGKPTGNTRTTSKNGQTVKETEYQLPDGSTVWRSQTETGEPDLVGKPSGNTRERKEGGKSIKEVEYVLPDGKTVWRSQTAEVSDSSLPEGLPQFRPNFNDSDGGWGLITYTNQLRELMSKRKPDGTPYLTEKQFTDLVAQAHNATTATAGRLDTIRAQQAQAQANEINQRNTDAQVSVSRLNAANSATQTALQEGQKLASAHTPESYAAGGGSLIGAIMALQASNAAAYGGMNQPARIGTQGYPVLDALGRQTIPAVADLTRPVPPNAIGVGSVGAVPAPGARPGPLLAGPQPVAPPPQLMAPNGPISSPHLTTNAPAPPAGAPANPPTMVQPAPAGMGPTPMPDPAQDGAIYDPSQAAPVQNAQGMAAPQTLPGVDNMTYISNVLGQRPPHASEEDWQRAVRQAASEMGWA